MGIIQKQGFYFTLISVAGTVVGACNAILLYPRLLHTYQIGIFQLLISLSIMYAQVSQAGIPTIISKFFPEFKSEDKKHSGFITWILVMTLLAFTLSTVLFLILKGPISGLYAASAKDFTSYYYLVVPLAGFTLCYSVLDAICKLIYKSILSYFLNSFFLKISTSLGILLYYYKVIDFSGFLYFYTSINALICLIIFIQLALSREFKLSFRIGIARERHWELVGFGLFTLLGATTFVFLSKMDTLILGQYKSESVVGVYSIYLFIVTAISIPSQSFNRVSYQLVADAWVRKDMKTIGLIYHKTSIVQMLFGSLLLIGIIINRETLLRLLHKPEFRTDFNAFYFVALAALVDITGGLNTYIITVSHKYRVSTVILIFTTILCVILCYLLVPRLGASGAALSLLVSYTFLNFVNWLYIKIRFKLQPFNSKHLILLIISLLVFAAFSFVPTTGNTWIDLVVRSSLITIVFGFFVIVFNISEDINRTFFKFAPAFLKFKG